MPHVVLHLFGPFRAERDGAALRGISRRGQGLLAYLACQPGMHAERGVLADLLWSDRGEAQGRASLRQELSLLRKVMGKSLEADSNCVWLAQDTVEICRGTGMFLQGFDLTSEGFEDWLRTERQRDLPVLDVPAQRSERPALAVLPFEEIGGGDADMFADGIVEEITGALSRSRDFDVIARQSAVRVRRENLSVQEIAERLGASYLLEGSVRRSGDRVRVSVQLISAADGHTRWSERFDDRLDDLFDLQDRIATQVAGHLSPNLRAAEIVRARQQPAEVRSAYDLVLTALPHFWVHDPSENRWALQLLDAALVKDPESAHAQAMKAWCHAQESCYLWTPSPETAKAACRAAFDLAFPRAQDHSAALTALSAAASLAFRDFRISEDLARRALDLDPNNAWAWLRLGWAVVYLGRPDEGLACFDRAEKLSPLDPFLFNMDFGRSAAMRVLGRLEESLGLIEKGIRAAPKAYWAYRILFKTLWLIGERERAIEAGRKWVSAHPGISTDTLLEGLAFWQYDVEYPQLVTAFEQVILQDGKG